MNWAAILHGVLHTLLKDHLNGRVVHGVHMDPKEEQHLLKHLTEAAN